MTFSEDMQTARWGLVGFFCGVVALMTAVMMTSGFMAPEPEQSIGTTLGEIARDIRLAATGATADARPVSSFAGFDLMAVAAILTPVFAAAAAVLGGISLYRHEPTALPKLAIGLGVGAFVMQFAFWLALLICGTVLLISIVSNKDGILGD